jgi:hypothetical protein
MSQTELILLAIGVTIIIPLATYAGWMLVKLSRFNKEQSELAEKALAQNEQAKLENRKSITILASALQEGHDKLTLTEAAMRISVLGQNAGLDDDTRMLIKPFEQLSQAAAHIPILEEWQKLHTAQKIVFNKEREDIEYMYRSNIEGVISPLLERLTLIKH